MATYKAVLRVKYASDQEGVVAIRKSEAGKHTYHRLKIKVPRRYWNDKSGTVRKNDILDYVSINNRIAEKLEEFKRFSEQEGYIESLGNKASYINYFENEYLPRVLKHGSNMKYKMLLGKVNKYLEDVKKPDLLFNEIDTKLVHDLYKFMLKKCSVNTGNHYLKMFRQVLDSAVSENLHNYIRHPFIAFKFSNQKVRKSALSIDEIKKIIDKDLDVNSVEYETRYKFLFQIFMQGMRVSDIELIRYQNIVDNTFQYKMFKTGTDMTVEINDFVWSILIHQFKKVAVKENLPIGYIRNLESKLEKLKQARVEDLRSNEDVLSGFDNVPDSVGDESIVEDIRITKKTINTNYRIAIDGFSKLKEFNNYFVFDFLQDEDFNNLKGNDFSKLTDRQYQIMKNKSIVYNRHLKQLQKKCGISTNLTSHLSRHSYASLMLLDGHDVYVIGKSLGHVGGLAVTEKYLSGLHPDNTGTINKSISGQFTFK